MPVLRGPLQLEDHDGGGEADREGDGSQALLSEHAVGAGEHGDGEQGAAHMARPTTRIRAELAAIQTEFERFVVIAGADAVAVDAIGRYTEPDNTVSVVSSCDVYAFRDGLIATITIYAVEP